MRGLNYELIIGGARDAFLTDAVREIPPALRMCEKSVGVLVYHPRVGRRAALVESEAEIGELAGHLYPRFNGNGGFTISWRVPDALEDAVVSFVELYRESVPDNFDPALLKKQLNRLRSEITGVYAALSPL